MSGLIFLGTPAAALPSLEIVHATGDLALVVTMPDRPRGRSGQPQAPPVKVRADTLGVPVAQPASRSELDAAVGRAGPLDLAVVVAYGRIISQSAFTAPAHGMVNVHFSLLPKWRGAAPVERALLAGDVTTGVSLMAITAGLDTGDVYDQWITAIGHDETAGELTERLALGGAELLAARLEELRVGELNAEPQSEAGATYAPRIETDEARIEVGAQAEAILLKVRAFNPRPGAFARYQGGRFKVWRARSSQAELAPGHLELIDAELVMGTGTHAVVLTEVQPAGSRRMGGAAWARGRHDGIGSLE